MDGSNPKRRNSAKSRRRSLRTLQILDNSVNQTVGDVLPQNYGSVWINYDTLSPNAKCSRRSISRRSICDSFAKSSNNNVSCSNKENVYVNDTSVQCAASPTTSSCNTAISNSSETSSIIYGDIGNSERYTEASVPQECLIKVISAMCIEDGSQTSYEKQNLHSDLSKQTNSEDCANSQSYSGKFCEEFVTKKYDINNTYLSPNNRLFNKAVDSKSHVPENRQEKFGVKENLMQSQSPTAIERTSLSLTETLSQENNLTDSISCSLNNLSSIEENRAEVSDVSFNVSKSNSVCLEDISDNAIEMNYSSKGDMISVLSENYSHGITNDSKTPNRFNSSACSDLSLNSSSLSDLIPVSSNSWHFLTEYPEGHKKDVNTLSDSYLWNNSCESELSNSWYFISENSLNKLPNSSTYQCSTPCRAGEALPVNKTPDINKEHALPQSESESPLTNISGILKGIFVEDASPVQIPSKSPLYLGQNEQNHRTTSTPSSIDNRENVSAMQEDCILSFKKELSSSSNAETNLMAPDSGHISPVGNKGLECLMTNLNLTSNGVSKETSPKLSLEMQKQNTAASFDSSEPAVPVSKPKAKKSKSKVLESKSNDSEVIFAKRKKLRRRALNIIPIRLDIVNEEPIKDFNVVHMECLQEPISSLELKPTEETNQSSSSSKVKQLRTQKSASYFNKPMKDLDVVHMECCSNETATLEYNPVKEEKDKSVSISKVTQRRARKSAGNLKETNSKRKGLKSKSVQNNKKDDSGEKRNNVEMPSSQENSNTTPFRRCSKRKSIEVSLMLNKKQEPSSNIVADENNIDALKDIYLQKNYKPIKAVQLETIYDCQAKRGPNTLFSKKKISRTLSFETNPIKLKNRRKKALKNWPFLFEVLDAADKRQITFCDES